MSARHSTAREAEDETVPGAVLLKPVVLVALALWLLNDHLLKAAVHSAWTGKLSDVVSLIVFPLLPFVVWELWRSRRGAVDPRVANRVLLTSALAAAVVMGAINVDALAAEAYRVGLGAAQWPFVGGWRWLATGELPPLHRVRLTMDPTDLWTIPAIVVPISLGWRRPRERHA